MKHQIKMKKEIIEQLLERYWQCRTSLEEEKYLQEFFSGSKVPGELRKYIPLFQIKNKQKTVKAASYLKLLPEEQAKNHFYSIMKIAASFLVVLTLGIGFYTHYKQEKLLDMVLNETYTDPKDAVRHTGEIVAKVSTLLQLIPETVVVEDDSEELDMEMLNDSVKK